MSEEFVSVPLPSEFDDPSELETKMLEDEKYNWWIAGCDVRGFYTDEIPEDPSICKHLYKAIEKIIQADNSINSWDDIWKFKEVVLANEVEGLPSWISVIEGKIEWINKRVFRIVSPYVVIDDLGDLSLFIRRD